jgi:hypothetical protein
MEQWTDKRIVEGMDGLQGWIGETDSRDEITGMDWLDGLKGWIGGMDLKDGSNGGIEGWTRGMDCWNVLQELTTGVNWKKVCRDGLKKWVGGMARAVD